MQWDLSNKKEVSIGWLGDTVEDFTFFVDGYTFVTQLLSSIFYVFSMNEMFETQELFEDHSDFCASCCHSVTVRTVPFAARICRWF